ncbi:MAG: phosphotransferase family protein [Gammaproteobacteria bacterium]|nr:phosphotransferase family protein [Gammaproteobacteria bacterium]
MAAELEPSIAATLAGGAAVRALGPYALRSVADVKTALETFLSAEAGRAMTVSNLKRMGGGASKEQFVFEIPNVTGTTRCVLRMDPLEAAVLTNREREFAVLRAMQNVIPVPDALWLDSDGSVLGRPALITSFVSGVTKPSNITTNVSGFGTVLGLELRRALAVPFMRHLSAIHQFDWRRLPRDLFQAPDADPEQAARWQVNWWTEVWRDDALCGIPLMGLAERWLREHLPATRELVLVHSDYRTGNFLFDEARQEITAVLDWELAHIGDYHQDLAWIAIKAWSHVENDVLLASGLMPVDELVNRYQAETGRKVDRQTFFFYQVLSVYQCVVICLGTSLRAAHEAHNHQDALLSWLAAAGYVFLSDLADLLDAGALR